MRKFKVLLCLVAALCASALLLTSCTASKKYEKQVLNYLEDKYEGESFELLSYSNNKKTSSRYEIKAVCLDDDTEFEIYAYSANNISDGYAVTRANNAMRDKLNHIFSYSEAGKYVTDVRWLRLYNEEYTDYTFMSVENVEKYTAEEKITSIDAVVFGNPLKSEQVADGIITSVKALEENDIVLENIGFEFTVLTKSCRMESSTADIDAANVEEITDFINEKIEEVKDGQSVWMNYERVMVFTYSNEKVNKTK